MLSINVIKRLKSDTLGKLRKSGKIPAIFYGKKQPASSVYMSYADFEKVLHKAGETSVVVLKEDSEEYESLIKEVDTDPVTGKYRHADFYVFEKGKKIKIKVPIEFIGVAPAVKDLGCILVKVLHEIEIEAMPKDLPRQITVDLSSLVALESRILAKDINMPNGVVLIENPEEVVAAIAMAKEEKEVEEPIDLTTIEVEKKGKEKEGVEGEVTEESEAKPSEDKEKKETK